MALKVLVKLNNVTNLTDARYAAGMGVEIIGFPIHLEGENSFGPRQFEEIVGWLAGVKTCGEFDDARSVDILNVCENLQLDYVQVSGYELAMELVGHGLAVIWDARDGNDTDKTEGAFKYILKSADDGGDVSSKTLVVINSLDEAEVWADKGVAGLALNGTHEERPGFTDLSDLQDILESLEEE